MFQLTSKKNHDYAKEEEALANFKEFGAVGVLVRISDKFKRLKNKMWDKQDYIVDENLRDTQMDLAVYSVIMMIVTEEEEKDRLSKYPRKDLIVPEMGKPTEYILEDHTVYKK
jgi:IS4 transposase